MINNDGFGGGKQVIHDLTEVEAFDAPRDPLPQGYVYEDIMEVQT